MAKVMIRANALVSLERIIDMSDDEAEEFLKEDDYTIMLNIDHNDDAKDLIEMEVLDVSIVE